MIKRLDIIEPRVSLLCAPGFGWVVPSSAIQVEMKLQCPKGLNFKSRDNLSALEPSDPGPKNVRKFRVWPFCSASAKRRFNIVVVGEDILNSYIHSPDLHKGTVNSSCLRKSPCAACLQRSTRKTGCLGTRTKHFACCLGAKQGFSASVSTREQCLSFCASERGQDF